MKNKQNLHIHTTYADGKNTPEEIVIAAREKGFDSIGFSEHSFMPFSSYPHQMKIEDMPAYRQEVLALKQKYKDKIDIFCGIELESYSTVDLSGFDYVIGSVHYLDFDGKILGFDGNLESTIKYLNDNFLGDGLAFAKKYFETVANLPQKAKIDIIGHFDLVSKNNEIGNFIDTSSKKYLAYGFEAIRALKNKIPFFEVNTGAIARGYRSLPYPQMEFLQEFARQGFGVLITSDCHDKDYIDCFYSSAEELIKQAGFKTKVILTNEGFKEVGL